MIEYLTPKELETLKLLADGVKWDVIASTLHISRDTLKIHRNHIIEKLGANNTANAVYIAASAGII
jgi:DNA-binding NarL/FixJ family response regulator